MSHHDIKSLDTELNQSILAGDILGAFEKHYADDIIMQENSSQPTIGKDVNREREKEFLASIEELHGMELVGSAVDGDRSYSEWRMDYTARGTGRLTYIQVASRKWRDGKVVHERFIYPA